jgi:hypothetical protein
MAKLALDARGAERATTPSSADDRLFGTHSLRRDLPQQQQAHRRLDGRLWHYNHHRKHTALGHKPPIARLDERTNLLDTYS